MTLHHKQQLIPITQIFAGQRGIGWPSLAGSDDNE